MSVSAEQRAAIIAEHYPGGGARACMPYLPGMTEQAIRKHASLLSILRDGNKTPLAALPHRVGGLWSMAAGEIADRCARRIARARNACAVTVDPDGGVWVERPSEAAESDLVGVYEPDLGLVAITAYVRDDLIALREDMRAAA